MVGLFAPSSMHESARLASEHTTLLLSVLCLSAPCLFRNSRTDQFPYLANFTSYLR